MIVIQEFDLEIKPANIVRGQGLCKLVAESQDSIGPGESGWENELFVCSNEILFVPANNDSWYSDLSYFLYHGTCPDHLNSKEKRVLQLKSSQYHLINLFYFEKTMMEYC
jgi:hypothetical protein